MDDKLYQLIEDSSVKFNEWIEAINSYNRSLRSNEKYSTDEFSDLTYAVANVLGEISKLFFKYGSFKDKFDYSKMYLNMFGPSLIIQSEKTENVFYLGIDENGIYLTTYLRYSENLRYMDDSFYKEIFSLNDFGKFELIENQVYGKETTTKYPNIFNNNKSTIYRLFRNYFVGSIDQDEDIVLGDFHMMWTYDTDFQEIICNSCQAFKILYKLNYALWKVSDLKNKKNNYC